MSKEKNEPYIGRRRALYTLGGAGILALIGCESASESNSSKANNSGAAGSGANFGGSGGSAGNTSGGGSSNGGTTTSGGNSGSAGNSGNSGSAGATTNVSWATGGTADMTAASQYPDPFETAENTCALTCTLTQGPCWAPTAPVRQDVSEGKAGVPLRLALRVVESDGCTPVVGAEVEIWHCDIRGIYSADDAENVPFCTGNDAEALADYYFRGRAISDDDGVLMFDTCFPGWYPSRAVHIHFAVRRAAHAGEHTTTNATCISQFFFPEDLTQEIFASVDGYTQQGQPDTTFASDTVIGSVSDTSPYILEYEKMPDGAMLAWKTIAISDSDSC